MLLQATSFPKSRPSPDGTNHRKKRRESQPLILLYLQNQVTPKAPVKRSEHFDWTTLNICSAKLSVVYWCSVAGWSNALNILLNKAELRANINLLRTRELNRCSVTGQTHWTTLNISKNKGNVDICSVKSLIAIKLHWTRLNKVVKRSEHFALNKCSVLFSEMFSTFARGLRQHIKHNSYSILVLDKREDKKSQRSEFLLYWYFTWKLLLYSLLERLIMAMLHWNLQF